MPEKIGYGNGNASAVIRTPALRFEVVLWDWDNGREGETKDITVAVTQFRWLKSIANPVASCDLTLVPQILDIHYLDYLKPMDVVRIYEFGVLKYQGFIRNISAKGSISNTGVPNRSVFLSCSSFGALLSEGQLGVNMFLKADVYTSLSADIISFQAELADLVIADKPYSEFIGAVVDKWFGFLNACGATTYQAYLKRWLNLTTGMAGKIIPGSPKTLMICYGSEQSITLWSILSKLAQTPFNEMWFDCGPRKVWAEQNASASGFTERSLHFDKDYLVIRSAPYNGTYIDGVMTDLWDTLTARKLPLSYLTQFDLNKSMDESKSFYMVSPAVYDPGGLAFVAMGNYVFDPVSFNKYLYRPAVADLYYSHLHDRLKPEDSPKNCQSIYDDCVDKTRTLMEWNKRNDEYLSGAFTFMVPSNDEHDPRIGDKLEIEGIDDAYFYVESVSHTWSYGNALLSNAGVTRGFGQSSKIVLKDKIFKRAKFNLNGRF